MEYGEQAYILAQLLMAIFEFAFFAGLLCMPVYMLLKLFKKI